MTDPVERELARIRAEELRDLQRLGQEFDQSELSQQDDPDNFRASMTMWAVLALAAVLFAVWLAS